MAKKPQKTQGKPTPAKKKPAAKKAAEKPAEPVPQQPELIVGDFEFARRYNVTTKTIYTWRQEGMPARALPGNQYEYDIARTDEWIAARRSSDGDDETDNAKARLELNKAKLRVEQAKAEKLERENLIAAGNLLQRDEWELFAIELLQECRDQLIRIHKDTQRHMCPKCQKKVPQEIERVVNRVLERLGSLPEGPREDGDQ